MKFVKYLVVLTFALCAFASKSNAQTIQFLGGGSSAIAVELGQAAATSALTNTPCVWTHGKDSAVVARDTRSGSNVDTQGNIWITWSAGTGTCAAPTGSFNIYSYMNIDSVIGDRCYFEVDSSAIPGCIQVLTVTDNTLGVSNLPGITDTATGLPHAVIAALNGQHWFAIGTDIRPEDAKFQTYRLFTACGAAVNRQPFDQGLRETYGLGYQTGTPHVGTTILSQFSGSTFPVLDFNITGTDPFTGNAVPTFTVLPVGAQPMIIAVSPFVPGGPNTNIAAANDVTGLTLTLFYQGVLGRSTDLLGPSVTNPVWTLVREPLSGTYNTFEYSIPNTSQFHGSQDDNNCLGATAYSNPLNLQGNNGVFLSYRKRVIGTGEMTSQLKAVTPGVDRLGYFFWSSGNAAGLTNVKYLTVNGVDPIQTTYTGGVLPGNSGVPLSNVTFAGLAAGDYPIWSVVRIVTKSPAPVGATNLVTAAQTAPATAGDMIPLSNLHVWKSHYYLPALGLGISGNGTTINPATPGDLCAAPGAIAEYGGDAGASNVLQINNVNFCNDFGNVDGLIDRTN